MPGELFVQTLTTRKAPARSRWTLAGSILAHVTIVGVLFVVPVLSALDSFVLRANDAMQFAMPAVVMPLAPPPPGAMRSIAPDINPTAAPPAPPVAPVTAEAPLPTGGGGLSVPGAFAVSGSTGVPGAAASGAATLPGPPAMPPGPVRPGGDIKPPARVAYQPPIYPSLARTAHVEGIVILEATIDETGIVRDVRLLRSIPLLDRAAIEAVSQWRYTPTRLNGVPVPVILTVTVTFALR
jgi:protein TonB